MDEYVGNAKKIWLICYRLRILLMSRFLLTMVVRHGKDWLALKTHPTKLKAIFLYVRMSLHIAFRINILKIVN